MTGEMSSTSTETSTEVIQLTMDSQMIRQRSLYTATYYFTDSQTGFIPYDDSTALAIVPLSPMMKTIDSIVEVSNGITVVSHGALSIRILGAIQIDMTIDNAVWMTNLANNVMMTVDARADSCVLLHPCGRVFQYGVERVEVLAHDLHGNDKFAMMRADDIVFTSYSCPLVYLLDDAGLHTTFGGDYDCCDLSMDYAVTLFYEGSRRGPEHVDDAKKIAATSINFANPDGSAHWLVNGIHIIQSKDGVVSVSDYSRFQMMTSLANGSATMTTKNVRCMASVGEEPHLFARHNDSRVVTDEDDFVVTQNKRSAGFDCDDQMHVYFYEDDVLRKF